MAGFSATRLSEEVARGLKRGDPSDQAEAYRTLAPAVLGMVQRILGDRGLAEEIVQETFISVIERASSLKNPKAAVGWIRQTAVNHCLMRLRSPWQQRRDASPPLEQTDPNQDSPRANEVMRQGVRELVELTPSEIRGGHSAITIRGLSGGEIEVIAPNVPAAPNPPGP